MFKCNLGRGWECRHQVKSSGTQSVGGHQMLFSLCLFWNEHIYLQATFIFSSFFFFVSPFFIFARKKSIKQKNPNNSSLHYSVVLILLFWKSAKTWCGPWRGSYAEALANMYTWREKTEGGDKYSLGYFWKKSLSSSHCAIKPLSSVSTRIPTDLQKVS